MASLAINRGSYEEILHRSCEKWLRGEPEIPVLMVGMIGSRNGWYETGYLPCPVSLHSVGANIIRVAEINSHPVYIVPGISSVASPGLADVIRGEETQIFGVFDEPSADNMLACVPGTHSKWIQVDNNRITRFSTFMTGAVFAALRHCGSIASLLDERPPEDNAFLDGVETSQRAGGLLNHLFLVRARAVTGERGSNLNEGYLSGLLIGAEIKAALELYPEVSNLIVIGTDTLIHDYSLAFSGLDIAARSCTSEKASVNGLWKLARASGKVTATLEALHA